MEECCVVCAEPLVWLAYGSCGHRDICSTCIVRMRFILEDKNCCICKTVCPTIMVTKAFGDYTTVVSDFSSLPSAVKDGKAGNYWFHSVTNAYFDDEEHYKMIKAMCRLSCSICDKEPSSQENKQGIQKRDRGFMHIEQLKRHLSTVHKLFMCNLCLEGRKVFMCEQKLYTRSQLNRHLTTGDSEVDGNEMERGGFMGHPMCDFCRKPFYGDNELYVHMSTEHYTCHICQRRNPGHFEYYRNYDDLEAHFSQEHFLCENGDCLAKKFIVFTSEGELKRHNALEHAGNMSRSQRHAALQIPVSFRYRRPGEDNQHRGGRGRGNRGNEESYNGNPAGAEVYDLETAVHVSMLTASMETIEPGPPLSSYDEGPSSSSHTAVVEQPPRYLSALGHVSGTSLTPSAFPPLPGASDGASQGKKNKGKKTESLASVVRGKNGNVRILNGVSGQASLSHLRSEQTSSSYLSPGQASSSSSFPALRPASSVSVSTDILQLNERRHTKPAQNSLSSNSNNEFPTLHSAKASSLAATASQPSSSYSVSEQPAFPSLKSDFSSTKAKKNKQPLLKTLPNTLPPVSTKGLTDPEDFPALGKQTVISALPDNQSTSPRTDPSDANKALIQSIKKGLGGDAEKFSSFKDISSKFRSGDIDAGMYYQYILQMGLSYVVEELARLCPDSNKQKELLDVHTARSEDSFQSSCIRIASSGSKSNNRKGKSIDHNSGELDKQNVVEEAEDLSKDGYRSAKGKNKLNETVSFPKVSSHEIRPNSKILHPLPQSLIITGDKGAYNSCTLLNKAESVQRVMCGREGLNVQSTGESMQLGKDKRKKKGSKADISIGKPSQSTANGVWGNGGGQHLVSIASKKPSAAKTPFPKK